MTCGRSLIGFRAIRWCAACACSCTGTRTRSIASRRGRPLRGFRDSPQHRRLADYGWSFDLQVFAPQMGGRGGARRILCPKIDLRPAARRHARRPLPRAARPGAPAWCALAAARMCSPSFRPRHLHSSQRSGSHRRDRSRDGRAYSARGAACSAPTFRSRSSGPAIPTLVAAYSEAVAVFAPQEQVDLHDRVARLRQGFQGR